MEVHSHAHTPRKKWTHYFWEFLMLFLAVFCGFLAENFREHTVERHREKEYILSMIKDLATDTVNINTHFIYRKDRRRRLDSLSLLLRQPFTNTGLIYYYARWGVRNSFFSSNDRTIQQLKNAGGLRLIRSEASSDAIMDYDAQLKIVNTQSYLLEEQTVSQYYRLMNKIFDGNVFDEMYMDSVIMKPAGSPPLLTNKNEIIDEFISLLHFVKSLNNRNSFFEQKLKLHAISTIQILKKEYHLK